MIKHYMRPDSNTPPAYAYVVGEETDSLWNPKTCIEVPEQPSSNHIYNMQKKAWELNEERYMDELRYNRNTALTNTDKCMLSDYPISETDKSELIIYRDSLRKAPNKTKFEDRKLPSCPEKFKDI